MILKWRHFEDKAKIDKNGLFSFRSKIGTFDIFLKRLYKERFEDLEFNSNSKFRTRAALSHKMAAFNFFGEITQKSSFNSQYS